MTTINWKLIRIGLMGFVTLGAVVVLGKIILLPSQAGNLVSWFDFPDTVPLEGWKQINSQEIQSKNQDHRFLNGHHYQYQQNQQQLDVKVWYLSRTNGDVNTFFQENIATLPTTQSKLTLNQDPELGFYGLGATPDRVYLSACINPSGKSTLTTSQFHTNLNTYNIKLSRVLLWLFGPYELRDQRCIWTVLSMPLESATATDIYPTLKTAWFDWYQWWQPNFPPQ